MHTSAYEKSFGPNTEKLRSLLGFLHKGAESYLPELKAFWPKLNALKAAAPGIDQKERERLLAESREIAEEVVKQKSECQGGVATIHGLMAVFFVAIVEAYLKDVLIYAAGMEPTLMEQLEQTASYKERKERELALLRQWAHEAAAQLPNTSSLSDGVLTSRMKLLNAQTLQEVIDELRGKWAKEFVARGGPAAWMESLEAIGARGYRPNTLAFMERLWGVRHLIVHSAGIVTQEFVQRHSHFQKKIEDHFIVTNDHLVEWLAGMYDFVEVTDSFFVKRCAAKTEGR